jgi:hypothetical protein
MVTGVGFSVVPIVSFVPSISYFAAESVRAFSVTSHAPEVAAGLPLVSWTRMLKVPACPNAW